MIDPGNMLGAVKASAEQWIEGLARARAATVPTASGCSSVLYCGMGGSGIAGDVLASMAALSGRLPVVVSKGYDIPAWVDAKTFVICVSYSGNTEETLTCFDAAVARGARLAVISTGGAISERARSMGVEPIVPVEGLQPRAAFPSLCAETLVLAARAGILADVEVDAEEAGAHLRRATDELATTAEGLAALLDGYLPVIWGQEGPLAVAATRWRCQLNENAKVPAFSAVLPELDHNDIVGYVPGVPALEQVALVVLRPALESARMATRVSATLEEVRVGRIEQVRSPDATPLTQLLSLILLGDLASVNLAFRRGVDPTPVEPIVRLKARLA